MSVAKDLLDCVARKDAVDLFDTTEVCIEGPAKKGHLIEENSKTFLNNVLRCVHPRAIS